MKKNIEEIEKLLSDIKNILEQENESNWLRGIKAALLHIKNGGQEEFLLSKSVYKTMCNGGRGFMEYYIKKNDAEEQKVANEKLDSARDKLWNLFGY